MLGGGCLIEFDWCVWLQQYVCLVDDSGVFVGWVRSMCVRVWVSGGGGPAQIAVLIKAFIRIISNKQTNPTGLHPGPPSPFCSHHDPNPQLQ